jgi:hypothetical protein
MTVFFSAVHDLLEFGFGWLWQKADAEPLLSAEVTHLLAPMPARSQLPESVTKVPTAVSLTPSTPLNHPAYITKTQVRVWQRPVLTFDGEVSHLPFAARVELVGFEGRFAEIRYNGARGFVLKDEVTAVATELFPQFNVGEIYSANHPETKKLRRLQNDEFAARELYLPLQDVEFVSFELGRQHKSLPWGAVRPRIAGTWQNILKGKPTIQISITPKTGSILEFAREDGTGFVGLVESVGVDETITMTGVGRLIDGEYRREILQKAVWQEWRPVFIYIV